MDDYKDLNLREEAKNFKDKLEGINVFIADVDGVLTPGYLQFQGGFRQQELHHRDVLVAERDMVRLQRFHGRRRFAVPGAGGCERDDRYQDCKCDLSHQKSYFPSTNGYTLRKV